MKCNKCGTPIIPGDNSCRICGNADFSERVKGPEVIDFPDETKEIIEIREEKANDLPDLMDIIDIEDVQPIVSNNREEVKEIIDESREVVGEVYDSQILDLEQTIPLETTEPTVEVVSEPIDENLEQIVEDVKEIEERVKPNKKKVLEKANEKVEKHKKAPKTKKEKKSSNKVGVVLLALLLICSIALNAYLVIMAGNARAAGNGETPKTEETYSKVSYSNYKITMPSTWIVENGETSLLIYDETQNWSASMQVINDVDYDIFVENKESLVETLGNLKYQFTSNYSKEVEEKDFHLFKGKYYEDYSVYVMATELSDNSMLIVDLKFKGEVDDILLNKVLKTMTNVKENDTTNLFKDNFEFKDISGEIQSVSKNIE